MKRPAQKARTAQNSASVGPKPTHQIPWATACGKHHQEPASGNAGLDGDQQVQQPDLNKAATLRLGLILADTVERTAGARASQTGAVSGALGS